MERAYHHNILEWMWERKTGKFETKEDILKWKYCGKIGAKSENVFKKKGKKKGDGNGCKGQNSCKGQGGAAAGEQK